MSKVEVYDEYIMGAIIVATIAAAIAQLLIMEYGRFYGYCINIIYYVEMQRKFVKIWFVIGISFVRRKQKNKDKRTRMK